MSPRIVLLLAFVILPMVFVSAEEAGVVPANDPRIAIMGRADANAARVRIGYPGVTLRLRFRGTSLALAAETTTPDTFVSVFVDGAEPKVLRLSKGPSEAVLVDGLPATEHTVEIMHRTETWVGILSVTGFRLKGELLQAAAFPQRRLLFIGDSVTCGEAVERAPDWKNNRPASWNAYLSYGMRIARGLNAQAHLVCFGGRGLVRDWQGKSDVLNAPQFFDLAVPDETGAPVWDYSSYIPDAVFISLGTNDFNPAIGDFPERGEWVGAYVKFLQMVRSRYPKAHIFITEGAIVNDPAPPARPQKTVLVEYLNETARRAKDPLVHVLPSRHYPGDASDAHPTAEQHAAMAQDLEPLLREALGW